MHRSRTGLSLSRWIRARPRLFIAAGAGLLVHLGWQGGFAVHGVTRWLLAWDTAASLYVLLAAVMMVRSAPHHMRRRAQSQDEGKWVILAMVVVSSVANLAAIAGELVLAKTMEGPPKLAHTALAGFTVLSSWAFIQVMFTLHYAHDYYASLCKGESPGLSFPNDEEPEYGDFFHFAAVIGTSGQTADVAFVSKPMRRLGSVHCILAYLFNTTVLALLINIGASLV